MDSLSEQELAILALEGGSWRYPGAKDRQIRRRLGISPTEYYLRLNTLLEDQRAVRHAPMLIRRLRAQRDRVSDAQDLSPD